MENCHEEVTSMSDYQIKNYYLNYLCSTEESTKMNKRKNATNKKAHALRQTFSLFEE